MTIDKAYLDRLVEDESTTGPPPICMNCGYNLTGSPTGRCPECGTVISRREWRQLASEMKLRIRRLEEMNAWAVNGVKVGAVGAAVWLFGALLGIGGGLAPLLGRIAATTCGLAAFFLGMSLFRTARLPEWAREQLNAAPNYKAAATAMALGALLLIVSLLVDL